MYPVLRTVDRIQLLRIVAHRIEARDDGSRRGTHHHVDGYARRLHHLQRSDGSRTLRTAATYNQRYARARNRLLQRLLHHVSGVRSPPARTLSQRIVANQHGQHQHKQNLLHLQ